MALVEKAKIGQLALKVASDLNTATDRLVIWLANAPANADTAAITVAELASIIGISGTDAAIAAFRAEPDPLPQYALEASLGTAALASTVSLLDRANHTGTQAISTVTGLQAALNSKINSPLSAADIPSLDAAKITTGTFSDDRIPASIARDSEVTAAIATHLAATDPHSQYATDADLAAHVAAADPHSQYATDVDLANHIGATGNGSHIPAGGITNANVATGAAIAWTKLDKTGATAADVGAAAASHTQSASTITDFSEAVDDRVASLLQAGSNVTLTYDDASNTLTIASTGGSGGGGTSYTNEEAQDAVGGILTDTASINLTYNDAANTITADAIFGTTAGTIAQGNDARLSDQRVPTDGSVTNTKVASNAAIEWTKISKSGAVPSDVGAATAAQGTKADTALQPAAIGSTVQAYDADLQTVAGLSPTQNHFLVRGSTAWEARALLDADIPAAIARDSEVSSSIATHAATTGNGSHIPATGITNTNVATGAAIAWSKLDKTGATAADVGAATSAQGTKADTALQPAAIGSTVQAYDADLQAVAGLTPTQNHLLIRGATAWEARSLVDADIPAAIARDSEVTSAISTHAAESGNGSHIPAAGITNTNVATGAAIDWAKISKTGAVPADIGAATSAQGSLANTALQPSAIGSTVQGYDADLQAIAALAPAQNALLMRGTSAWEARALLAADIPNLDAGKITTGTFADSQIPASIARDTEVSSAIEAFRAEADPLTIYQKESEKGSANGYASLNASGLVPVTQQGTGYAAIPAADREDYLLNANQEWRDRSVLHLPEKTVAPSVATDEAALYAFDEDGLTALYYADSTGFVARPLRDRFVICRNSTGATITKGQAVYVNGFTSSGSSGDKPTIALASATAEATLPCIGLAAVNIAANGFGRVQTDGILTGINTSSSGATDGQRVLVSTTAGAFTATPPTLPNHVQRIGVVFKSHATTGSILIDPASVLTLSTGSARNLFTVGNATDTTQTLRLLADFQTDITANPTANRTLALPDKSGTIAVTSDITGGGGFTPQIHDFTASGTVVVPAGATRVQLPLLAGASGGSSGRKGAAGSTRFGGGGGAGGSFVDCEYSVADSLIGGAGVTLTVTVGAGGLGGAAVTADSTNGNNGLAGGSSTVSVGGTVIAIAVGGLASGGGSTSGGLGGSGASGQIGAESQAGGIGGNSSTTGTSGSGSPSIYGGAGGTAGSGIDAADVIRSAGNSRWGGTYNKSNINFGSVRAVAGTAGENGTNPAVPSVGAGGTGGVASTTGNGGAGGNGGRGCGGGGGGAATNGTGNSGAGGNGGDGFVRVIFS